MKERERRATLMEIVGTICGRRMDLVTVVAMTLKFMNIASHLILLRLGN
jgi:hypothetical protein